MIWFTESLETNLQCGTYQHMYEESGTDSHLTCKVWITEKILRLNDQEV